MTAEEFLGADPVAVQDGGPNGPAVDALAFLNEGAVDALAGVPAADAVEAGNGSAADFLDGKDGTLTVGDGDPTFWEKMKQRWAVGREQAVDDQTAYRAMTGDVAWEDVKDGLEPSQDALRGKAWYSEGLLDAVQMVPAMVDSMAEGMKMGMSSAMVGGTVAAVAGQAGPQVAMPEELVTVPGAAALGYSAGNAAGSSLYWYRQGAGSLYDALRREGIDHGVAAPVSAAFGMPYAAIELAQMTKLVPGMKQTVAKALAGGVKRRMAALAKEKGVEYVEQIGQETAQEVMQIGAEVLGEWMDGVKAPADKASAWDRIKSTVVQTARSMPFLMAPKAAVDTVQTIRGKAEAGSRKAEVTEKPATAPVVTLDALEGANSQEQFENLARQAGQPVEVTEAPATVNPPGNEKFAPPEEVPVTEEARTPDVVEDPFALDEPVELSADEYLQGGDEDAKMAATQEQEEAARYRAEMEAEMDATKREAREESGSQELLAAISELGGLPGRGNPHEAAYRGELNMVRESAKANQRMKIFRKDAPAPDVLATSLRERGFQIEGPNELWDLVDDTLRGGREVWSDPQTLDPYWAERQGMLAEQVVSGKPKLTPVETAERGDAAARDLGTVPVRSVRAELDAAEPGTVDEFSKDERLVALDWQRRMLKTGKVSFVGMEMKNAAEMAQAAQVYRDPRFETVRWFFTRNGMVVDTLGITSRNPRFTMALLPAHSVDEMVEIARKSGSDGVWLLHNHPSGDPNPSGKDVSLTEEIAKAAKRKGVVFHGHVVIDGNQFSVIDGDGRKELRALPGRDELLVPELDHELLGMAIESEADGRLAAEVAARAAANERDADGQVTLFLLTARRKIRAVTTVPVDLFLNRQRMSAYLHSRGQAYGVSFGVAFYDSPVNLKNVADAMAEYVRGAVLDDGLLAQGESIRAERRVSTEAPGDRYFGEEVRKLSAAERVEEEVTGERLADLAVADGPLRVESESMKGSYVTVPLRGLPDIRIIEMPEMVALAKELMGKEPRLRRLRAALGQFFSGDGSVTLDPRIFADSTVAAKVLAHELGHLADWLPDQNLKRGNIIGRLYSLKNHMKGRAFGAKTGIEEKKVRAELEALTKYWKPWDEAQSPDWYNKYRRSSKELYADAISVLFNSPATLKEMAPTFYREFFAWLDAKPEVKTEFFTLQAMLNQPMMELLVARSRAVKGMFGKAEEVFLRARERARQWHLSPRGFLDLLKEQLYDKYDPMVKRQRALEKDGKEFATGKRIDYLFDEHPLADNLTYTWLKRVWERVVQPLEAAEIGLEEMGEYLFFSRIMADRQGMANPLGHTPGTARAALLRMRLDLGPEKFTLLERGAERFHEYVFETVQEAAEVGIISKKVFTEVIEPNRGTYAAFRPIDYVEDYVPAGVYAQVGTLKEIENPWLTTVLKTVAMRRAIQHQRTKTGTVEFLQENFAGEIEDAETRFDGKRHRAVEPKDRDKGLLEVRVDGAWKGYVVPAEVARMFDVVDPAQASAVLRVLNWVFKKGFYNVWVRFNPVFQLAYSPIRDAQRFYVNMPKAGAAKMAAEYLRAMPAAYRRLLGKDDPMVTEMYENLALATPHDSFARNVTRDDGFEQILEQFHITKEPEKSRWLNNMVMRPVMKALGGIEFAGQIFEAAPKIAAFKILTRDLGWDRRDASSFIRNYVGVPNYLRKGKHAMAAGSLLPFWNVAIQGLSSDGALMSGKERNKSAASWWFRWALAGGGFAVMQALARTGLLGDEPEEWYGGVSDYDFTNYMVIPLGMMPGGDYGRKVVYLRLPQDEMHRMTNGILKKFIEIIAKQVKGEPSRPAMNDLMELAGYSGGQLPGINPALTIGGKWMDFMNGLNPYDAFRGRHVLSNGEFLAGGWESLKPMLGMTWDDSGLGNFYRFNPEADTTMEMTLQNIPVMQRLVKVSDRGYSEQQREGITLGQAENARLKLAMPENAQKLAQEYGYLRSLGKKHRAPGQELRWQELRVWHRTIYTPYYEAAQMQEDAGMKVDYRGLDGATAGWE